MSNTDPQIAACICGHTAYWHSHDGLGDCEHDGACQCAKFEPEPVSVEVATEVKALGGSGSSPIAAPRSNPTDREIRVAALRLPDQWIVEDVVDSLGVTRLEWGTHIWHVVRDLVNEGLVSRRPDGFYEVVA